MQELYRETAATRYNSATTCNRVRNCGITDVCDVIARQLKRYRNMHTPFKEDVTADLGIN